MKVRKYSNFPSTYTKMNDTVIDIDYRDDSSINSTSSSATEPIVPDTEESKNGWTQVPEKVNKSHITATAKASTLTTVRDHIKQRGEELVDVESCIITPVILELRPKQKIEINIRDEFIKIFHTMKKFDPTISILSNDAVWHNSDEFPVDEKFLDILDVKNR